MSLSIILLTIFSFFSPSGDQKYSLSIRSTNIDIEGSNYKAYVTTFVQNKEEVEKAWWRYIKSRASIFNTKDHLVLTIPVIKNKSNTPIKLISKWSGGKKGSNSTLTLALIQDVENHTLQKEIKGLLLDFKTEYFTEMIESNIIVGEKSSKNLSLAIQKKILQSMYSSKKGSPAALPLETITPLLDSLNKENNKLEAWKVELKSIR